MSRLMGFIHDEILAAGHFIDYFCADSVGEEFRGRLSRFLFPLLVARHTIVAARSNKPYDIVNVHEASGLGVATLKAFAGNPKVVVTSHGVEKRNWELQLEESYSGRALRPPIKTRLLYPSTGLWQANQSLRRADHILCLNFEDRDYLSRWLRRTDDQITRIWPGVGSVYATAAKNRDYHRVKELLFAGTWIRRKGIDDLVKAFVSLTDRHPDLSLTVMGAGVSATTVREAFPEVLRQRVTVAQSADEETAAAVFAACDVFILPSLFEGTPLTLIEAMASGLPIVTTDTCGMKDVIQHAQNGLLVPVRSADKIAVAVEALLSGVEFRARLGREAQSHALTRYGWGLVAAPVRDVYERLCQ